MTNSSLFAEAKRFIPGGVNSPVRAFRNVGGEPFFVSRAKGSHIWDVEGREYIDYVGTWGPAILGHAPDVVVEAVRETAKNGLSFGIPNPLEVEMARLICTWVPSVEKVRMVNSGTEATMSCVRLARGATDRKLIVKFEGCYHGHVDSLLVKAGSGALTHGSPDSAGIPQEFADLTIAIPFNNSEVLAQTFQKFGEQIAAVIVEAVPANAGLYLPRPGFYEAIARSLRPVQHVAYLRRGDDRLSRRQGRISGTRRNQTRSHGDGQGYRRRVAGRGIWRSSRHHEFAIAGWPCLPGWNSLRQSAGHGRRAQPVARTGTGGWLDPARRDSASKWRAGSERF